MSRLVAAKLANDKQELKEVESEIVQETKQRNDLYIAHLKKKRRELQDSIKRLEHYTLAKKGG